jgi:hypothetical protein
MCNARSNRILVLTGEGKSHSVKGVGPLYCAAWRALVLVMGGALVLSACHKADGEASATAPAGVDAAGYLEPPTLTGAVRDAAEGVILSGKAPPDAEVRLRDPGGGSFSATASSAGDWSIQLTPSQEPRMFAFEGQLGARVLHAEGALLVLPYPGPAAVLMRAGYGAMPIEVTRGPFHIEAIDYDGSGGAAVSGVAAPRSMLRLVLDDKPVGAGQADDQGHFTVLDLSARSPMTRGQHTLRVESQTKAVQGPLTVDAPPDLPDSPFRAMRVADGWRVDWRIPGGGVQTTMVFDQPSGAQGSQ